jgi:hypothetical protein
VGSLCRNWELYKGLLLPSVAFQFSRFDKRALAFLHHMDNDASGSGRRQRRTSISRSDLHKFFAKAISGTILLCSLPSVGQCESIAVRIPEGPSRGFLVLRDLDGTVLASGEEVDVVRGGQVISRLTFRFKDGSLDDETTVFSQHSQFQLISDHHIQRGPSFPHPVDTMVDAKSGMVTVRSGEGDKEKVVTEHMDLPADLSNGMITTVIRNLSRDGEPTKISMVAGSSKPRLVKLAISSDGDETFFIGGIPHKARRYLLKIELGGVAGAVAPVIGKAPRDGHVWMAAGSPSTMLRAESQLYEGGPIWSIQTASPTWEQAKR